MYYGIYDSPLFPIIVVGNEEGLIYIHLETKTGKKFDISEKWIRNEDFFKETFRQLDEYFKGQRMDFDLKLNPNGTEFQKKVWNALIEIPFGTICSYKDIAMAIDNPKACRAVGMANSKNPIAIVIPCHRVIGKNGKLVGYAGGIDTKEKLLDLEKSFIK
ncbi:methylated-DNA--protein-cysteine methyltransferase [Vallitalea longa]|uniref:Methylated-DNA--protein-cysteine methyltransferase n=1 Tax=Vallitalea longa TaxID=2936439 RepID=A0A9W5YAX4_9FIRM|nr:methylated-DNA--[protein]-cysteine S-methyltransferase [Vallitalea longa]GKX29759.1 methylated-DNA--protein-cysteine methyltransferase [Vallitalea longa]